MKTTKIITVTLMFACALALIVWDVVVATNKVSGDTISETTLGFAQRYPIAGMGIAFAFGIIVGHLVWPQYPSNKS
jgi:hypothetical protein